jgi:hypothetical protein
VSGPFRVDTDPGPFAEALTRPRTALSVEIGRRSDRTTDTLQALVDRFRNESGGRTAAGILPVHIDFPAFGPSIFLASELTAETSVPAVELLVKRVTH